MRPTPQLRRFSTFKNFCKKTTKLVMCGDCDKTPAIIIKTTTHVLHKLINLEKPQLFAQITLQRICKHDLPRAQHLYIYTPCFDNRGRFVNSSVPILQWEDDSY